MIVLFVVRNPNLLRHFSTPQTTIITNTAGTPPENDNDNLSLSGEKINPMHGSNHWSFERAISVATFGLISVAAIHPHSMVDFGLGIIVPLHCHIGFGAIITDYLPKRKFPVVYRFARGALYASTAITIYGLYKYNTEDVGITEGIKTIWAAKKINFKTESE